MFLLEIKNTNKCFNGKKVLDDFSCKIKLGQIVGLIGPNGAGKSTLFNIITGFIPCNSGQVFFNGRNITGQPAHDINKAGISRTFQKLRLIEQITVLENVLLAFKAQPGEHLFNVFFRPGKSNLAEAENTQKAIVLLEDVGLMEKINEPTGNLSYGQQKLLSLACCLASGANLLLLDEPIAGINPALGEKILAIIKNLSRLGKSVMLIEHDMEAITRICDWVIFMDAGKKIKEGTPEDVRNAQETIDAYLRGHAGISSEIKHA